MSDDRVCGFCRNGPVGDAATWLDGIPREPAPCPRCGVKYAADSEPEVDIGTCQSCGRYHDFALVETCPCGGYVG